MLELLTGQTKPARTFHKSVDVLSLSLQFVLFSVSIFSRTVSFIFVPPLAGLEGLSVSALGVSRTLREPQAHGVDLFGLFTCGDTARVINRKLRSPEPDLGSIRQVLYHPTTQKLSVASAKALAITSLHSTHCSPALSLPAAV